MRLSIGALAACAALAAAGAASAAAPGQHHPVHHRHHRVDHSGRAQVGKASYYARSLTGAQTASGKTVKATKLTAASKTLPLGTKAKVTNLDTGKSVKITVTDRGPYKGHRILDVSREAATKLGMKHVGVATVRVQPIAVPPAK